MVNVGNEPIQNLFIGEMGIKSVFVGTESVYTRPGGYIYLNLQTQNTKG